MKYFAKYIPVDGKIKETDRACFKPDNTLSILDVPMGVKFAELANKQCKAAKLFLCSRDIQVGDKVICKFSTATKSFTGIVESLQEWGGAWVINPDPNQGFLGKPCLLKNEVFKVIGEISPEAIWIKEGDEFDEYEEWWWDKNHNNFLWKCNRRDNSFDMESTCKRMLKLKCDKCNTFH